MKSRTRALLVLLLLVSTTPSCFTMTHVVGGGPTANETVEDRQWYWMFGLFRFYPHVDTEALAGNATSYRVTSCWSLTDALLNLLTAPITIVSRSVKVEK